MWGEIEIAFHDNVIPAIGGDPEVKNHGQGLGRCREVWIHGFDRETDPPLNLQNFHQLMRVIVKKIIIEHYVDLPMFFC